MLPIPDRCAGPASRWLAALLLAALSIGCFASSAGSVCDSRRTLPLLPTAADLWPVRPLRSLRSLSLEPTSLACGCSAGIASRLRAALRSSLCSYLESSFARFASQLTGCRFAPQLRRHRSLRSLCTLIAAGLAAGSSSCDSSLRIAACRCSLRSRSVLARGARTARHASRGSGLCPSQPLLRRCECEYNLRSQRSPKTAWLVPHRSETGPGVTYSHRA